MKTVRNLLLLAVAFVVAIQFVHPAIPSSPTTAEVQAPETVRTILRKDCYSCHSSERRLSWFDQIEPGYWLVRHDVLEAREHLNFSTLGAKPAAAQKASLYEAVSFIQLGSMPLPQFRALHPEARVTPEELATLKAYLAPWSPLPAQPAPAPDAVAAAAPQPVDLTKIAPELNGFPFAPDFEGWHLLSVTDRGDNNTFRFILGNDVAMRAVGSGSLSPWPDGAKIAKIAWQQEPGVDGLVHAGKFVQVELMAKEAQVYRSTEGWGWGRWRGLDLKPYGKDAAFVKECTGCHFPVKANDEVYTLPLTSAHVERVEVVNTRAADLPSGLPFQPLGWRPVTMFVDPVTHSMAVLLANEVAARNLQVRGQGSVTKYPAGAVLALVTWSQRDDPHWFGGRIPDAVRSVEFVKVNDAEQPAAYTAYGNTRANAADSTARQRFILGLKPATLP